jgi:galactose-1-phosphate uridylyltransferase
MEAWAVPKRAVSKLSELHAVELQDLAPILKQLVNRLSDYDINHNLSFEQGVHSAQRLMVKIRGRNVVSPWGGLEVSTGVIINTIPPEAAAEWYRRSI